MPSGDPSGLGLGRGLRGEVQGRLGLPKNCHHRTHLEVLPPVSPHCQLQYHHPQPPPHPTGIQLPPRGPQAQDWAAPAPLQSRQHPLLALSTHAMASELLQAPQHPQ